MAVIGVTVFSLSMGFVLILVGADWPKTTWLGKLQNWLHK